MVDMSSLDQDIQRGDDPFPIKLHRMLADLEKEGKQDIVSWGDDGRCFSILQPKVFADTIMKKYFRQTKYKSFQRQMNLYDFRRETVGKIKGVYYHELFVKDNPNLCRSIRRTRGPSEVSKSQQAIKSVSSFAHTMLPTASPPAAGSKLNLPGAKTKSRNSTKELNVESFLPPAGQNSTRQAEPFLLTPQSIDITKVETSFALPNWFSALSLPRPRTTPATPTPTPTPTCFTTSRQESSRKEEGISGCEEDSIGTIDDLDNLEDDII